MLLERQLGCGNALSLGFALAQPFVPIPIHNAADNVALAAVKVCEHLL